MRGYTNEQLEARGMNVANYVGCLNCRLHWHRRVFEKHFNVAPPTSAPTKGTQIEIINPAWERFMKFLVEGAVKQVMKEHADKIARGEPVDMTPARPPPTRRRKVNDPIRVSVDEAVARYGFAREEIMAEFVKNAVPFEVELRSPPSRRGKRPAKSRRSS